MRAVVVFVCGLAFFACGCKDQTYKGKSEKEWVALSKDGKLATRQEALQALHELGRYDALKEHVYGDYEVSGLTAAYYLAKHEDVTDRAVELCRNEIRRCAEKSARPPDELYVTVKYLGKKAGPLRLDVAAARRAALKRKDRRAVKAWDVILQSIP